VLAVMRPPMEGGAKREICEGSHPSGVWHEWLKMK